MLVCTTECSQVNVHNQAIVNKLLHYYRKFQLKATMPIDSSALRYVPSPLHFFFFFRTWLQTEAETLYKWKRRERKKNISQQKKVGRHLRTYIWLFCMPALLVTQKPALPNLVHSEVPSYRIFLRMRSRSC